MAMHRIVTHLSLIFPNTAMSFLLSELPKQIVIPVIKISTPCRATKLSIIISFQKSQGTGVALYVNDKYTYTRLESLCRCTANIERLFFIKVTNFDKPYTIGVVYRPPNGSEIAELGEIDNIMQILANERVLVFGDYNFDLFKPESQKFESCLYENNMIPLVSNPTHFKTGCDPSLIDNILTNSIENIIMSGVLENGYYPAISRLIAN